MTYIFASWNPNYENHFKIIVSWLLSLYDSYAFLSSGESHSSLSVVLLHVATKGKRNWTFLLLHEFLLQFPMLLTYKTCYIGSAKLKSMHIF